ncbi:MAG: phage holin family protein [Actinomycetia bacterium]|nr:phage holin family protein [Actinomycetes bacterium]
MIGFLVRAAIFLLSAAIGLLVAKVTLDGMSIDASSFIAVVVTFAVLQSVLAPFFARATARNAPALLGATGLISTFVALLVADLISDGLTITGVDTWLLATLIVWITTMLATLLLPIIVVKLGIEIARERRSS